MERDRISNLIETERPLTFREIVQFQQEKWGREKRRGLRSFTQVSQAIDIPKRISDSWMGAIIDNLPNYISEDQRQKLTDTHPNPIYTLTVLNDRRNDKPNTDFSYEPGVDISKDDLEYWLYGGMAVSEFLIRDLTNDILNNLKVKHRVFGVSKKLTSINPDFMWGQRSLKREFGGGDKYEAIKPELMRALLSGETESISAYLQTLGYSDINDFFIRVSKEHRLVSRFSNKFLQAIDKTRLGEKLFPLVVLGFVVEDNPGIVNVTMLAPAMATISIVGNPLISVLPAAPILLHEPMTVVHETAHYLSYDINHWGLLSSKTSRKVT